MKRITDSMKKLSLILFLALVLFACGKQHDEQLKTTAYHKTAHVRAADGARECMDIDMQIEFPTESQNPEALTPIQQSIMQHLFPDYCASMPIKEAVNAYADCSAKFIAAMSAAIRIGTYEKIHLVAPFLCQNKADVVKVGLELGAPYELTWSCYAGGDKPCGQCATCLDRAAAFAANNVKDPALDG